MASSVPNLGHVIPNPDQIYHTSKSPESRVLGPGLILSSGSESGSNFEVSGLVWVTDALCLKPRSKIMSQGPSFSDIPNLCYTKT